MFISKIKEIIKLPHDSVVYIIRIKIILCRNIKYENFSRDLHFIPQSEIPVVHVQQFGNSNKKLIIHLYMEFRIHVKHVGLFVNDSKVAKYLYQIRGHRFFRSQTRRGARYTHYRHNVRNNMYMILLNNRGFLFCLFISWIRVFYQPSFLAVRPLWTELNFIFLILPGLQLASKEKLEIDLP